MKERTLDRRLVLAGIGAAILGVLGSLVYGDTPDFVDDPAAIADFYSEESGAVLAGNSLYLLSGIFLLWFVAGLRAGLERADGAGSPLAAAAAAGGGAGAALMIAAAAVAAVGGLRADEQGSIGPQSASVLWDISSILYGLAAPMAWAAAVLATAAVALRSSVLPSWLGWVSLVMGIALAIPPINFISIIVMNLWVIAVAVVLYMDSRGVDDAQPGVQPVRSTAAVQ